MKMTWNKPLFLIAAFIGLLTSSCKSISYDSDGFARVEKKGQVGLLDKNGKVVLPYAFESIGLFDGNVAVAKKNGMFGAINTTGKLVIPFKYSNIRREEGFFVVTESIKFPGASERTNYSFLMDYAGEQFSKGYYDISSFHNDDELGLYACVLGSYNGGPEMYGLINREGKEILPCCLEEPFRFNENGLATVKQKGEYGIMDRKFETVVPLNYATASEAEEAFKNRWIWGTWREKWKSSSGYDFEATFHFSSSGMCSIHWINPYPIPDAYSNLSYRVRNDEVTLIVPDDEDIVLMRLSNTLMVTYDRNRREIKKIRNN